MICRGCSRWAMAYRVTLRSADGRIESATFCPWCYHNLLNGLPSCPTLFPSLLVVSVLAVLDTLLVCIATAPWFVIGGLLPRMILAPVLNGVAIALLLALQTILLWRVRRKPATRTVVAASKLNSDPSQKHLWDCELDG
jgi:hypothetical protein